MTNKIVFAGVLSSLVTLTMFSACTDKSSNPKDGVAQVSSQNTQALKPLTNDEAIEDFESLFRYFKKIYAPYEYKQRRFKIDIAKIYETYKEKFKTTKSDAEVVALFNEFLATFRDGHVSIDFPTSIGQDQLELPFSVDRYGEQFIVSRNLIKKKEKDKSKENKENEEAEEDELFGLKIGDEIVSIDGKKSMDIYQAAVKYDGSATDETRNRDASALTVRPAWMPEGLPTDLATLVVKSPGSAEARTIQMHWKKTSVKASMANTPYYDSNPVSSVHGTKGLIDPAAKQSDKPQFPRGSRMGNPVPFFLNAEVAKKFGMRSIDFPNMEILKALGYQEKPDTQKPKIFAAYYVAKVAVGKSEKLVKILLIRQPTYSVKEAQNYIAVYQAIMNQYEPLVDILVIDQTYNPGGSINYVSQFASIFAPNPFHNSAFFLSADRTWLGSIDEETKKAIKEKKSEDILDNARVAKVIDLANTKGLRITETPVSFDGKEISAPNQKYTWDKPVLILANEFSGSGGDSFPQIMQKNGFAKVFGNRTMGLGGNVEEVVTLPNSGAKLRLTRSLMTVHRTDGKYTDADLIENNGVTPDFLRPETADDIRTNFVKYVSDFSEAAIKMVLEGNGKAEE